MAEAGDVDGSMVCAQQAEAYKLQHDTLHTQLTAPERVMTVCEVCGVFINSTDNDQRRQVRKMSEVRRRTAPPQLSDAAVCAVLCVQPLRCEYGCDVPFFMSQAV